MMIFLPFAPAFLTRHPVLPTLAVLLSGVSGLSAWTPGTGSPLAADGFVVNPMDRRDVLAFSHAVYNASENYAANMAWTGSVAGGVVGTTSAAFKEDVRRRINFYRALSALPADITFDATKSAKDQEAALMFARNGQLSHAPPSSWIYYTANAYEAAKNSIINLSKYGPAAVDSYMRDDGASNAAVGHRRWLHYSRAQVMGTGDVPSQNSYYSANAIWVTGGSKPAPPPQFVAWPNRGYISMWLVPARWSLSYPGANFAGATVTMTQGAANIPTTIVSNAQTGLGDNTLVWVPSGVPALTGADTPYNITVSGISGTGVPTTYSYTVTSFDPSVLGDAVAIDGTNTPPATGAGYTFNSIAQADAYELSVTTATAAGWNEGAEDPSTQIVASTTGGYPLRQSAVVRTGGKAFQLAFPDFSDQSFTIVRDVIPSASSSLQFYHYCRYAVETNKLSAEISTDNGSNWTAVWNRFGVGLSGVWDPGFYSQSVSLAAYAGQVVRLRFILRSDGGSIYPSTTGEDGFFIDDVSVTNATELVNATTTSLLGAATSFTLNNVTAGAPLIAGSSYYLRIRPNVGTHWFPYSSSKIVTAQVATGYQSWVATQYPAVTGGPTGDHDGDGIPNGVEYAFGLNPAVIDPGSALPQPVKSGDSYTISFAPPAGITGLTYGAQWSGDLSNWIRITDSASGGSHIFTVSQPGDAPVFFRYQITFAP